MPGVIVVRVVRPLGLGDAPDVLDRLLQGSSVVRPRRSTAAAARRPMTSRPSGPPPTAPVSRTARRHGADVVEDPPRGARTAWFGHGAAPDQSPALPRGGVAGSAGR